LYVCGNKSIHNMEGGIIKGSRYISGLDIEWDLDGGLESGEVIDLATNFDIFLYNGVGYLVGIN